MYVANDAAMCCVGRMPVMNDLGMQYFKLLRLMALLIAFDQQVFEAAPQEARGAQSKRAAPDYFL